MNKRTAPRTKLSVSLMLNKYMILLADSTHLFTVAAGNRVLNLNVTSVFWQSVMPN